MRDQYRSGKMNESIDRILAGTARIKQIYEEVSGPARQGTQDPKDRLAPPDQPRNPRGPMQPRSSTAPDRSYSSSTRSPHDPGGTSTGR